jgi:hypothetical protein
MNEENWKRFTCYLAARAREASTWQALILILTAFGVQLTEDQKVAALTLGLGIAGALGALFPDRIGNQQSRSTDQGETK